MSEKKFIEGLLVKPPRDGAPEYLVGKLSMKRQELIAWLQQQDGEWINADIKIAQSGKWYAQVDDWKPNQQRSGQQERGQRPAQNQRGNPPQMVRDHAPVDDFADDDIPF